MKVTMGVYASTNANISLITPVASIKYAGHKINVTFYVHAVVQTDLEANHNGVSTTQKFGRASQLSSLLEKLQPPKGE